MSARRASSKRLRIAPGAAVAWWLALLALASTLPGCGDAERPEENFFDNMRNQARFEPLEANPFYADGRASREPVPGTVARGSLEIDPPAREGGPPPAEMTRELLRRGQERFMIYCAPCHGALGEGDGMIVRRGFPQPPSYHIDRLREAGPEYFVNVMENGFGRMPSYGSRVAPRDRWAIAAYIQALQLSQSATMEDVPEELRERLEREGLVFVDQPSSTVTPRGGEPEGAHGP